MRFSENFNPEWGYLSPAPGFMRTVRITVVAAAIGAIAGGGVVFSLVEHPEPEEASIAARTLIEPAGDLSAPVAPSSRVAPLQAAVEAHTQGRLEPGAPTAAAAGGPNFGVIPSSTNSVAGNPADTSAAAVVPVEAAISEEPAPAQAGGGPEAVSTQRSANKTRHIAGPPVRPATKGPLDLLRSFAARATTWPPRAD
jgi:hypothetical protein